MFKTLHALSALTLLALAACGGAPAATSMPQVPAAPAASMAGAEPRDATDMALDAGRKPDALMKLLALSAGMHVAEIGAGGGYTSELLARAVGPTGRVYGQNSKMILEKFAEVPWSTRLRKPVMKNVVRVDREFDAPIPEGVEPLDLVLDNMFYHDTVWMGVDRNKMNASIFAALRPGGRYVIIDHSSKEGAGVADVKTLHRIEQSAVVAEVTKAGFVLAGTDDFLKNPKDPRDWSTSPMVAGVRRGESDRFTLVFRKP